MADFKEVRTERHYVKVPGGESLRKRAESRHKHLVADGWREVSRTPKVDHVQVTYERAGVIPLKLRLPKGPQEVEDRRERRRSGFGGPGGFGGRGRGGGPGGGGPRR
ncbi:MAG: hypothetical protein ACKO8G_06180 [Actinomycetota bacterium]